jgi:DNA-directed RNA polymerase specialized sigma subunit
MLSKILGRNYMKTRGAVNDELRIIKQELNELRDKVERIEIAIGIHEAPRRAIDLTKLIEEVSKYLREKKEAYPSDIADYLNISEEQVMEALEALKRQKKVGEIEWRS